MLLRGALFEVRSIEWEVISEQKDFSQAALVLYE